MACPFFRPSEPCTRDARPRNVMLPLGDLWSGDCHSDPLQSWLPDDTALRQCNLGYARGACPRFSGADPATPDAVRFTISRDDGDALHIYYVTERDHHPLAHGPLDYSRTSQLLHGAPDPSLSRQAMAYIRSYLQRIPEQHAAR